MANYTLAGVCDFCVPRNGLEKQAQEQQASVAQVIGSNADEEGEDSEDCLFTKDTECFLGLRVTDVLALGVSTLHTRALMIFWSNFAEYFLPIICKKCCSGGPTGFPSLLGWDSWTR